MAEEKIIEKQEPKKEETKIKKPTRHELEQKILELEDLLLRNRAELENFKKRMQTEKINDRKFASKNLIELLLNPLDQFDRVVNMTTDNELLKNFLTGFKMINTEIYKVLQNDGLKEIDAYKKPFDPKYHYAVEKVNEKTEENNINLEVIQKGYLYKEQLLRPAMVKINEWSEENGKDK